MKTVEGGPCFDPLRGSVFHPKSNLSFLISVRLIRSRVVHLCCSAFGSYGAVSERAFFYSTLCNLSLSELDQISLHLSCSTLKVNEVQRSTCPVSIAEELCVEGKDFGANKPEMKS